jgi:lipoate-protein ligase B
LVRARAAGETGDWLLYPDHPPVLTLGRGGDGSSLRVDPNVLAARGIELFEVTRGGDLTWHGPGQLVGYPIVDLTARGRDLHVYLRTLEEALIEAVATWAIEARTIAGRTGVWVGERKLASIGIAVRRWVGYHGFALNVAPDLGFFDLIHPCGLRGVEMTSLAVLAGPRAPSLDEARRVVTDVLARRLEYDEVGWAGADEARAWGEGLATGPAPDGAGAEVLHPNERLAGGVPAS